MARGASRFGEWLKLQWLGLLVLPGAIRTLLRLWWQRGPRDRATYRRLCRARRAPLTTPEPLRPLEPGLFRVEPAYLDATDDSRDGPTVLHLLGTGENRYTPLPGLAALCRLEPRLRRCRHVIADTPVEAAAFLGADEFGTRVRRSVEPELARNPRGLVVIGLSRGGLMALELGTRLASELPAARVGVVAFAPPLREQHPPPDTVALIGALEAGTDVLVRQIQFSRLWALGGTPWIRYLYTRNCARVLSELQMDDDANIAMFGRYLRDVEPRAAALRATREFGLLGRVSDAELRHAMSGVMRRITHSGERLSVCIAWGLGDVWVDVPRSLERAQESLRRAQLPGGRVQLHTLPGWNHALGRQLDGDLTPLSGLLWQACEHVTRADVAAAAQGAP